jgi:IS66 C-terminal element
MQRRPASRLAEQRPPRARLLRGPAFRWHASLGTAGEGAARRAGASDSGLGLPARHGQNDYEIVLGRKNYLFAGSDAGGERAANIYSLIGTCLLNGIEPYRYLREVLERIPEHPINRIEELLPWNFAPPAGEVWPKAA